MPFRGKEDDKSGITCLEAALVRAYSYDNYLVEAKAHKNTKIINKLRIFFNLLPSAAVPF